MNKTGKMIYSSRRISTNLQILYRLLSHLRLRIALCPNWSQVGGIKLKVFGACHQVVVKPGSPLSIPKHSLYRLQPPLCSLVVYCSWVTITCQEVTHHRYVTPVRKLKATHKLVSRLKRLTEQPMKRRKSFLVAAQQSVEVSGQDLTGARVSQGATVVAAISYIPAGSKVPTRLCTRFQIHPQLLFLAWGKEKENTSRATTNQHLNCGTYSLNMQPHVEPCLFSSTFFRSFGD